MLEVTFWYVGLSNGKPVDIFYIEYTDWYIYGNRSSAVFVDDEDRINPIKMDEIIIKADTVRVRQIVEDQDGLQVWAETPQSVKDLYGWSKEIQKNETRRL